MMSNQGFRKILFILQSFIQYNFMTEKMLLKLIILLLEKLLKP